MQKINAILSSRLSLLFDVIRNLIDPIELLIILRPVPVDVIIITSLKANGDPSICGPLLWEHPRLKILILTPESEAVYIYQTGIDRIRIEEPSR